MQRSFLFVAVIALLMLPTKALAEAYDYHPRAAIALAGAFDPLNITNDKSNSPCFLLSNDNLTVEAVRNDELAFSVSTPNSESGRDIIRPELSGLGSPETVFSAQEAADREALYRSLGISSQLSARFGIKEGVNKTDYSYKSTLDEKSLTYVLNGRMSFFDEAVAPNISLTRTGKRQLKRAKRKRNPEVFFEACGREIVTRVTRGVNVSLVYNFRASSAEEIQKLKNNLSAKFGSFSGTLDIEAELQKVSKNITYDYYLEARAGPTLTTNLTQIINAEPGNLAKIKQSMEKFFEEASRDSSKAPIVRFISREIASEPFFLEAFDGYEFDDRGRINEELKYMHSNLARLASYRDQLEDLEQNYNFDSYRKNAIEIILTDKKQYLAWFDELYDAAILCNRATEHKDCIRITKFYRPIDPNRYLAVLIVFTGWEYSTSTINNPNAYWRSGVAKAHIAASFTNPSLIKEVEFLRGNERTRFVSSEDIRRISASGGVIKNVLSYTTPAIWGYKENPEDFRHLPGQAKNAIVSIINDEQSTLKANVKLINGRTVTLPLVPAGI